MLDKILSFLPTDNTALMIVIGVVALIVIISIIKSLFKIALIAVIIGTIAVFGFGMTPEEVMNKGKELASYGTEFINDKVKPAVIEGIKEAVVTKNEDGTYTLKSDDILVEKNKDNESVITVKSLNATFTLEELSKYLTPEELQQVKTIIEQAK